MRKVAQLTPSEIHGVASHLNRLHRPEHGIHWESVEINIYDNGQVYLEWNENQGTPYLTHVPCSELSLTLSVTPCALAVPEAAKEEMAAEDARECHRAGIGGNCPGGCEVFEEGRCPEEDEQDHTVRRGISDSARDGLLAALSNH